MDKKADTEILFNYFIQSLSIKKTIYDYPSYITSYQFEGDYSTKKVFPDMQGENMKICVSPITFETPIYKALIQLDQSYDSTYYQNEIRNSKWFLWSEQNLILQTKVKFIKSRLWSKFYREISLLSVPLFSKNGQVAVMTFGSITGRSIVKKNKKVFIFKKTDNIWTLVHTINSVKNW